MSNVLRVKGLGKLYIYGSTTTRIYLKAYMNRDNDIIETQVKSALSRLSDSLGSLEIALEGRLENDAHIKDAAKEVQRMGADRTRLAGSLDEAEARCQHLEEVNREVSNRLVNAMENIRKVLDVQK